MLNTKSPIAFLGSNALLFSINILPVVVKVEFSMLLAPLAICVAVEFMSSRILLILEVILVV
jgi:hypothetical protein